MRKLFLPIFGLLCAASLAQGELASQKQPIEITASGDTNYQDGVATAHGNVAIHGDAIATRVRTVHLRPVKYWPGAVSNLPRTGLFVGVAPLQFDTSNSGRQCGRTTPRPRRGEISLRFPRRFSFSKGTFTTHDSSNRFRPASQVIDHERTRGLSNVRLRKDLLFLVARSLPTLNDASHMVPAI